MEKWFVLLRENWFVLLKEKWYFVCVLLLVLWLTSIGSCIATSGKAKAFEAEVGLLKQELTVLQSQEVELQERVKALEGNINTLAKERDDLKKKIELTQKQQTKETKAEKYSISSLAIDAWGIVHTIEDFLAMYMNAAIPFDKDSWLPVIMRAKIYAEDAESLLKQADNSRPLNKDGVFTKLRAVKTSLETLAKYTYEWEKKDSASEMHYIPRRYRIERYEDYREPIKRIIEQVDYALEKLPVAE